MATSSDSASDAYPRVIEVLHAVVRPGEASFSVLMEREQGSPVERAEIRIDPAINPLQVVASGHSAELHAARCLKAGQALTVLHRSPSLWTASMPA